MAGPRRPAPLDFFLTVFLWLRSPPSPPSHRPERACLWEHGTSLPSPAFALFLPHAFSRSCGKHHPPRSRTLSPPTVFLWPRFSLRSQVQQGRHLGQQVVSAHASSAAPASCKKVRCAALLIDPAHCTGAAPPAHAGAALLPPAPGAGTAPPAHVGAALLPPTSCAAHNLYSTYRRLYTAAAAAAAAKPPPLIFLLQP